MDQQAYRIAYLITGFIRETLTEEEHEELDILVNESDHNMQLFEDLTDEKNLEENLAWMDQVQTDRLFKAQKERGAFELKGRNFKLNPAFVAAASLVLIVGGFFFFRNPKIPSYKSKELADQEKTQLLPGGNRATLTLADGSQFDLTSAKIGTIEVGKGSHVSKPDDGELVYEPGAFTVLATEVHTLSTPVGGQYQVTLHDGTKVWLNAASSLRYPSHFSGNERKVELEGEAFFEVAKNSRQPFRVILKDSASINVLGTHFNVMAYKNEKAKKITLVEGKIAVKKGSEISQLQPGMQARIEGGEISSITGIDIEEAIGWKKNLFVFHDASIETIMRQVERWYDAKVVYQGEIRQLFNATIHRDEPLSKLLHLLELNGYVHFKIENKTIYVLP